MQGLARQRTLLERRFYVVVPAESAARAGWRGRAGRGAGRASEQEPRREAARRQLTFRCDDLARQLGRCGLAVRRLADLELAQLYLACWSPERARAQRFRQQLDDYTTLAVRAAPPAGGGGVAPMLRLQRRRSRRRAAGAVAARSAASRSGTRSLADLLAPAAVEVARDHVRLEYQYARVLVVVGYPRTVAPGWLTPLLEFEHPIEVSLHVHPLETASIVKLLEPQAGPAAVVAHWSTCAAVAWPTPSARSPSRTPSDCATRCSAASSACSRSACTCCCGPARSAPWTT